MAAIRDQGFVRDVKLNSAEIRAQFTTELQRLGLNPIPSHTNFVLCQLNSAEAATTLAENLRTQGIIVRVMRGYNLPHCIRITLGTASQMEEVVATLENAVGASTIM